MLKIFMAYLYISHIEREQKWLLLSLAEKGFLLRILGRKTNMFLKRVSARPARFRWYFQEYIHFIDEY